MQTKRGYIVALILHSSDTLMVLVFTNIALWDSDSVTYMMHCDFVILLDTVGIQHIFHWCTSKSGVSLRRRLIMSPSHPWWQVTPSTPGYQYKGFGTIYSCILLQYMTYTYITIKA